MPEAPQLENFLRGEKVYLSALTSQDAPILAEWSQDSAYLRLGMTGPAVPRNVEQMEKDIRERTSAHSGFWFGMRLVEDDRLIGEVELESIHWQHRFATLAISIGGQENWDKGYGSEAVRLALRFAFDEINLYRVQLSTFAYNERAIRAYRKAGFQQEGIIRQMLERDGQRWDVIQFGMLLPEWEALKHG